MNITYRTVVMHLRPTPLGLLGERWTIEHWCNTCRQRVSTNELVAHARGHHHAHGADDSLPIAARLMHNVRPPDRHNDTAPVLPTSTTDTHQHRR
jgi:hypothetical protein